MCEARRGCDPAEPSRQGGSMHQVLYLHARGGMALSGGTRMMARPNLAFRVGPFMRAF